MGKAYKCDMCKKYHDGHHYASMSIRLQKVDPRDGQNELCITICEDCCEPLEKAYNEE